MRRDVLRWGPPCSIWVISMLVACSSDPDPTGAPPLDPAGRLANGTPKATDDPCADPTQTSCPCSEEGAQTACGNVQEVRGDYVICSMGVRSCTGGAWSECVPERSVQTSAAEAAVPSSNLRLQALSSAPEDCKNLCDPLCMTFVDTPDGVSVDVDLQSDGAGLTLPGNVGGGTCSAVTVSPSTSTVTITYIASNGTVMASPSPLALSATCSGGAPLSPLWTMDAYDRAVLDTDGQLQVFSGIASPILVTATTQNDSATALVDVRVDIAQTGGASSAVIAAFDGAGSSTDSGKTLYPYRDTVFPLDLKAPLVQWDTGGNPASEVQVALRYPAGSSSPSFWYSQILSWEPNEGTLSPTAPAWQIPQEIWSAFDRTAAGDPTGGEIIIQRRYGGVVRPEMKIPVRFASAALAGTVYYTQYRRHFERNCPISDSGKTQACTYTGYSGSYTVGQICEVGWGNQPDWDDYPTTTRAIDLSQTSAPNQDPFNGAAGNQCPVCHSVSADGSTWVSASQGWVWPGGTTPGRSINNIETTVAGDPEFTPLGNAIAPTYTGLCDTGDCSPNPAGDPFNNQERMGEASRGFSYGAISPDGSIVLQGPAFWGNTEDTPASGTVQSPVLTGLTGQPKQYFFAQTAMPGLGVQFATTGPLPSYTWSAGTFTGSSGSLTVDGFTLNAVDQSVLVKDEAVQSRNGVYRLTETSPWKLERRDDANSSTEVTPNMEVRVTDGNANRGKIFFVASPASGSITVDGTSIGFAERVRPGPAYTAAPRTVHLATTGPLPSHGFQWTPLPSGLEASADGVLTIDGVAVVAGQSVLVKNEPSTPTNYTYRNGIFTVQQAGSATSPWILRRRSDADASGELQPLEEIRVTGGATNAGKVFYVSTPAPGSTIVYTASSQSYTSYKQTTLPSMMVPVFSPNGSKIAYVNGDADQTFGLAETGWRRGLSMLSFDQATMAVTNKVRLLNNYPGGAPFKWPFFESDSRSLIVVETEAGEFCSSADSSFSNTNIDTDAERACYVAAYGQMSPTTRGYWKGKLFSIDTQNADPAATKTELARLNDAEDATDADHAYQPTVYPLAVGGYRWVIFTSTRAYGNQLNMKAGATPTHFTCASPLLWVSAIDDATAGTTDRSHPAFLLPGQNMAPVNAVHYINERGYLVPSPCKGTGLSCSSDDQCCGAEGSPATAACRAPAGWVVAAGPPAKTCQPLDGTCSDPGESCGTPADCCDGAACVNFVCEATASAYTAASFEREYEATCPDNYQPTWQQLSYYATIEGDSRIDFSVQTARDAASLDTASVIDVGSADATVLSPAPAGYQEVGQKLTELQTNGMNHLRVIMRLVPSSDGTRAPILHDWEMRYTCEAAQ